MTRSPAAEAGAAGSPWPSAPTASRFARRVCAGLEQRCALAGRAGRDAFDALQNGPANPACRHVDDAPEAHVVVRIDHQPHERERVFDLLALVEADAADDAVRHTLAHQRVFDRARLRVRAIQHGGHRVCGRALSLANRPGDEVGFLELVGGPNVQDLVAARLVGPEALVLPLPVAADDRRRGVEDHLRRSVVLFELHDVGIGKIALEIEDVAEVGAAPAVNGLIRIARRRTDCGALRPGAG